MPEKNGNYESAALAFDRPPCAPSPSEKKPAIRRSFGPLHRNRRIQWLLAGVVVFLLLCNGIFWLTRHAAPVHYITATVTPGVVARAVSASGTVNPILTIIVGSYVSGVITEQYADLLNGLRRRFTDFGRPLPIFAGSALMGFYIFLERLPAQNHTARCTEQRRSRFTPLNDNSKGIHYVQRRRQQHHSRSLVHEFSPL